MRIGVQPYRSPAQPTHYRHGNEAGGGLRVRRVRLSVLALNPIYRRRRRRLNGTGITATSLGRRRHHWKKHFLNRVIFEMESFKISDDQVRVATETFKKFDKRGQDKISTNDLGPAFRALKVPITPDLIKEWADEVDDDATGFIDLKGFLSVYCKILQNEQDEQDLRQAFRALDKNGKGEIDVEDLRWILKELGDDLTEEEIDEMIRDTDRDGSGFVDFSEFKKLMTSE
uniref:Calmodulin n=1 Tax=Mesocestoides corti TaxID=53468 RepID=A0A5K3FN61_MESCO